MNKKFTAYDGIQDILNLICEIKDANFKKNPKYLKDLYLYASYLKSLTFKAGIASTKKELFKIKN